MGKEYFKVIIFYGLIYYEKIVINDNNQFIWYIISLLKMFLLEVLGMCCLVLYVRDILCILGLKYYGDQIVYLSKYINNEI